MKVIIFFFFVFTEKVLFKWKGSVYKLIFKEMIVYLLLYFILNGFYRAVLTQDGWEVYRYAFESLKGILEISINFTPDIINRLYD